MEGRGIQVMTDGITTIAGFNVPSRDPLFLSVVALHVALGLAATVAGAAAMLSRKCPGRHPSWGTTYFWSVGALFVTATALSAMRWRDDYHLFILGAFAFVAAWVGRTVRRRRRAGWATSHVVGMGSSYVLLLTAFYVDNGRQLPLWRAMPSWSYWIVPAAVGAPFIVWALIKHPVVKLSKGPS
jgi:hypothetical protein